MKKTYSDPGRDVGQDLKEEFWLRIRGAVNEETIQEVSLEADMTITQNIELEVHKKVGLEVYQAVEQES